MQNWLMRLLFPKSYDEFPNNNLNSDDLRIWLNHPVALIFIKVLESKIAIVRGTLLDNCQTVEDLKLCKGKIVAYQAIITFIKIARKPREVKPNGK